LTSLLTDANVPLYLADDIVEIFRDETERGFVFDTSLLSKHRSFLKQLCEQFPTPKATSIRIGIEGLHSKDWNYQSDQCDHVTIVTYDFMDQVNDLLNDDTIFGNLDNFIGTIDMVDPFGNKPPNAAGLVDKIHDGKWFQDTVKMCSLVAQGEPFMVLPVIGYIDKTGTDVNQRNKLEPFSFTLSILNRGCRFTSKAWRVLGFVPDMEHKSSATMTQERNGFLGKGRPSRNYHRCLSAILNSLSRNQGLSEPIYGCVRIGDRVARRQLFFPLAFVIGDALSGDQLCGRYKNYSDKVQRLSRCCDVPFIESDNLNRQCVYLRMSEIQEKCHRSMAFYKLIPSGRELTVMEMSEEEDIVNDIMVELQQLSTQLHQSAFCNIWFGDNPNGIYGATPTNLMDAFLHGIIPYVIKLITLRGSSG